MSDQAKTSTITDEDYQALINDFNANDDPSFLGQRLDRLFEKIVDEFPDNVALIHNGIEINFQQLNASANTLARGLARRGLKHGDLVGLSVSRSVDLVIVVLAVLKLGAAYVPIDPSFPAQRIGHMVEDANLKLILLSEEPTKGLARWKDLCLGVSEARDPSITDKTNNLETEIDHHDLAYVIYMSGSTGRPKGVEISHGATANFLTSLLRVVSWHWIPALHVCRSIQMSVPPRSLSYLVTPLLRVMSTSPLYGPRSNTGKVIPDVTSTFRNEKVTIQFVRYHDRDMPCHAVDTPDVATHVVTKLVRGTNTRSTLGAMYIGGS